LKSPGTWNNNLGVPLTLFMLQKQHEWAVLEMGMNHLGELAGHCAVAKPNVAILTNIGHAHIGELGSIENIANAKAELFAGVGADGTLVVNADDPRIAEKARGFSGKKIMVSQTTETDVCIRSVKKMNDRLNAVRVMYGSEAIELETEYFAKHLLSNLLCALGGAYALNVPVSRLQEGVDNIHLPPMRLALENLSDGLTLVDDAYNANPDSVRVALEYVSEYGHGRKVAILGDMLELGANASSLHRGIGSLAATLKFENLFCVGAFASDYVKGAIDQGMDASRALAFEKKEDLIDSLSRGIRAGDCVLVKGSRGSRMEEVAYAIRSQHAIKPKEKTT